MDAHTFGAWLGAWREGISSSTMPIYPTRGQRLPYRGHDMEKTSFPPLQHTHLEIVGSNPVTSKNLLGTKFNCLHEGITPILKLTFLSHFLPIQLTRCYLDPSFLLFLLPLESLSKLLTPSLLPTDLTIFLFYPLLTSPVWIISQFEHALWVSKIPTTSICNYSASSALIVLWSFSVLGS